MTLPPTHSSAHYVWQEAADLHKQRPMGVSEQTAALPLQYKKA